MAYIPPHYRERFQQIAQHEMGHYVASRHFGFRTGYVSVHVAPMGDGHKGGAAIELNVPIRSTQDLDDYLSQRIIVLYAGVLSEPLSNCAPVKKLDEKQNNKALNILSSPTSGAYDDHNKSCELRAILRNIRFPDTSSQDHEAIKGQLEGLEHELVNLYYETICGLAANLTQRIRQVGDTVTIEAEELEALPAVQAIIPLRC